MESKDWALSELSRLQSLHSVLSLLRLTCMLQTQVRQLFEEYGTFEGMGKDDKAIFICMAYEEAVRALGPLLNSFNFDRDNQELNEFIDIVKEVYADIDPCKCAGCEELFKKD
jgi:hypothetical protein